MDNKSTLLLSGLLVDEGPVNISLLPAPDFFREHLPCPSTSPGTLISICFLFALEGVVGVISNIWLLFLLSRNALLHQPTYFLLALFCLADLLICFAVVPVSVLSLTRPIPPNITSLITGTAFLWIAFLLVITAGYRLKIVSRECVDETKLTSCAAGGFTALLAAFFVSLQHLFTPEMELSTRETWRMDSRSFPDLAVFLASYAVTVICHVNIAFRSHHGHLRMVRHGRLFQNEFAQMKEWQLNRSLFSVAVFYFVTLAPWMFVTALYRPAAGNSSTELCGDGQAWMSSLPLLLACLSTWFPLWFALNRKDIRTDVLTCMGAVWRQRKEELPVDRSSANIRCIAFRNEISEFI